MKILVLILTIICFVYPDVIPANGVINITSENKVEVYTALF